VFACVVPVSSWAVQVDYDSCRVMRAARLADRVPMVLDGLSAVRAEFPTRSLYAEGSDET
jgi:hypothetical protein